jgi:hypothetical protein
MVTNNGMDANQSMDACGNRTPVVAGRDVSYSMVIINARDTKNVLILVIN